MKEFMMIRNSRLAPIQAFTVLGLSTARGNADSIGQFGSGSKHGVLTMMRAGITPTIFIGLDELRFFRVSGKMGEKEYEEVWYEYQGEKHKTGMCLEFGALDWSEVRMALREFICNALDQGENIKDCVLTSDSVSPNAYETRIFVPMDHEDVRKSWEKLADNFLHVEGLAKAQVFESKTKDQVRFFRRGVFVNSVVSKAPPLFSYNFQDGRIDESRNMDGAAMGSVAAKLLLREPKRMEQIYRSFQSCPQWEHEIGSSVYFAADSETKNVIRHTWQSVFGDATFIVASEVTPALQRKAIRFIPVPHGWGTALRYAGVVDAKSLLSELDNIQAVEVDATETAVGTFERVWGWLESVRMTDGKPFPDVKCFSMPMIQGGERLGYYRDGTVFLNLDYDTSEQTALEELAHYITGAEDETRDFQDFAFKFASRTAKRITHLQFTTK